MSLSRKNKEGKSKAPLGIKKTRVASKALALSSEQSSQAKISKLTSLPGTLQKSVMTYLTFDDLVCLMETNKYWEREIMALRMDHCVTAYKIFKTFTAVHHALGKLANYLRYGYGYGSPPLKEFEQLLAALNTLNTLLWQQKSNRPTFLSSNQVLLREQIKKLVDENGKTKFNFEDHKQESKWVKDVDAIFDLSKPLCELGSAEDEITKFIQDIDDLKEFERQLTIKQQELKIAPDDKSQKSAQLKQDIANLKNEKLAIEIKIQPNKEKYILFISFREKVLCSRMTRLTDYFPYHEGKRSTEFKRLAPIWNRYQNHLDKLTSELEKLLKQLESVKNKDALQSLQKRFDVLKASLDEKMHCSDPNCEKAHSYKNLLDISDVISSGSSDPVIALRLQVIQLRERINNHEPPSFLTCDNTKLWCTTEDIKIFWGDLHIRNKIPMWKGSSYNDWHIEDMLKFACSRFSAHVIPKNSYGHIISEKQVLRAKNLPDIFKRFLRIWVDAQGVYHCAYPQTPKQTAHTSYDPYKKRLKKNVDSHKTWKQAAKEAWSTICKYSNISTGVALPRSDLDKVYPIQSWVTKLKVADKKGTGSEAKSIPVGYVSFSSGVVSAPVAPVFSPQPAHPTALTQVVPPMRREHTHSFGLGHFSSGSSSSNGSGSGSGSASGFDSKHAPTLFSTAAPVLTPASFPRQPSGVPQSFPAPAAPVVALRDSSKDSVFSHQSFFASSSSAAAPAAPVVSSPPTLPAALTYEALSLQQEDSLMSALEFFSSGSSSSSGSKDADFDSPEDNHSDSANFAMVAKKGGGMGTMGRWGRQ